MPATPMSTPTNVHSSSNPVTLTQDPELHISTLPLTLDAARSILELTMSTRASSNAQPVSIPLTAYPKIFRDIDKCYQCGIFGHREWQCGDKGRPRTAEPPADWRRTTNGKIYSLKALLGMPPYQKWSLASLTETLSNTNDTTPSGTPMTSTPLSFPISTTPSSAAMKTIDLETPSTNIAPIASSSSTIMSPSSQSKVTKPSKQVFNSKVTP